MCTWTIGGSSTKEHSIHVHDTLAFLHSTQQTFSVVFMFSVFFLNTQRVPNPLHLSHPGFPSARQSKLPTSA